MTTSFRQIQAWMYQRIVLTVAGLLVGIVLACPSPAAHAQDYSGEDKVKAAYLYNFSKFVFWPEETLPKEASTITISILGEDPFGSLLEPLTQLQSQGKAISIVRIKDIRDLPGTDCQILFIAASQRTSLADIINKTKVNAILTVSDMENFARQGGMIGLVRKQDKIRLEINLDACRRAGLEISAKLLEIATIVR